MRSTNRHYANGGKKKKISEWDKKRVRKKGNKESMKNRERREWKMFLGTLGPCFLRRGEVGFSD